MPITNPQPILYPFVNGRRWDFSAVTFAANGAPFPGLSSIDYGQELKPGEVYANGSPQIQGMTRGQLKPKLSADVLAEEYENLIIALCALNGTPDSGYMEVRWDLQIAKQDGVGEFTGPLYVDLCRGVKIDNVQKSYKSGPEGLLTKIECSLFYILENGQAPVTINPGAAGLGQNGKFVAG